MLIHIVCHLIFCNEFILSISYEVSSFCLKIKSLLLVGHTRYFPHVQTKNHLDIKCHNGFFFFQKIPEHHTLDLLFLVTQFHRVLRSPMTIISSRYSSIPKM